METSPQWVWPFRAQVICNKCLPTSCGSLPHIELLINEYLIQYVDQKLLEAACERGASQQILEFIFMRTTPNWRNAALAAARGGHLHVFRWMMERQDGRGPWMSQVKECFDEAAEHGHLELLKWLHNRCAPTSCDSVLARAAASGHLAVVQWLGEHTDRSHASLSDAAANACILSNAAANGHFQVVKWTCNHVNGATCTVAVVSAMSSAARSGHLHILKWIHVRIRCATTCSSEFMDKAVSGGHFNVVKWLFENCGKGCSPSAARSAAQNGDLEMLQWLDKQFNDRFDSSAMDEAARKGHFEVVKWLHMHRSEGCTTRAMDTAAEKGHLEIVQWLHVNRSEGCTQDAMDWATSNGHLDVMRWLHEHRSLPCSRSGMYLAARDGNLETLEWLNENKTGQCRDTLMETAAWKGHLDVVPYLNKGTIQRAHRWGLGPAAEQGHMQALLVMMNNYDGDDPSVSSISARIAIGKGFDRLLIQLSDQAAKPDSSSRLKVFESLDQFHRTGFHSSVCIMLDAAMNRRHATMVRQFFQRRSDQEKRKYLVAARRVCQISLMRWMIENGAPLDVTTAINICWTGRFYGMKQDYPTYVEVAWWLKESDRVSLVAEGLSYKNHHHMLLLWVLENTFFQHASSRSAIRRAIKTAPTDTIQWLSENLLAPAIRAWCFEDEH